jgi:GT2 family glycosyltransferase
MAIIDLTVSIVVFRPNYKVLERTLESLSAACKVADVSSSIFIIDNEDSSETRNFIEKINTCNSITYLSGHGNLGYGCGNNLVLGQLGLFHLILNYDVIVDVECIKNALDYLKKHIEIGLVLPFGYNEDGSDAYLCKRFPSPLVLAVRAWGGRWVKSKFRRSLSYYQMEDCIVEGKIEDPPFSSGCFMLFRSSVLHALRGFRSCYFLYFEDFDLSSRAHGITKVIALEECRVIHFGGDAGKKGAFHIYHFFRSALLFYTSFIFQKTFALTSAQGKADKQK